MQPVIDHHATAFTKWALATYNLVCDSCPPDHIDDNLPTHEQILLALQRGPKTSRQLMELLEEKATNIYSRVYDLHSSGRIVASGKRPMLYSLP